MSNSKTLPVWVRRRHACISRWATVRVAGEEGYLGCGSLLLHKVWFDPSDGRETTVLYLGSGEAAARVFDKACAESPYEDEGELREVAGAGAASEGTLPAVLSQNHGAVVTWAQVVLDGKLGYLGVSSGVFASRLWFDGYEGGTTIVSGTRAECLEMFDQVLDVNGCASTSSSLSSCSSLWATTPEAFTVETPPGSRDWDELSLASTVPPPFPVPPLTDVARPLLIRAVQDLSTSLPVYDFGAQSVPAKGLLTNSVLCYKRRAAAERRKKAAADCIASEAAVDETAAARLASLCMDLEAHLPGRSLRTVVGAQDGVYTEAGCFDKGRTAFYTPNRPVAIACQDSPCTLLPACSVHPYRTDAVKELRACRASGARLVKWVPHKMRIDPSSLRCSAFYEEVRRLGMCLHWQCCPQPQASCPLLGDPVAFGDPRLVTKALNHGVRVVVCLVGLESPDNVEAFLQLAALPKYSNLLFADTCGALSHKRLASLHRLLDATDVHHRIVYASGYPAVGTTHDFSLSKLVEAKLLARNDSQVLQRVRDANPLLAHFVALRLVKSPAGNSFPASVFHGLPYLVDGDEAVLGRLLEDGVAG